MKGKNIRLEHSPFARLNWAKSGHMVKTQVGRARQYEKLC